MLHTFARAAASAAAVATIAILSPAMAQEWNMPTPYPDSNFHTENIKMFAEEVAKATGGKLKITVHSAGALYKHPEIKNAVRSGQVPIGEFLMSLITNEDALYGIDSQPFLVTTYDQALKLWKVQKPAVTEALAKQNLMPLFSVAWPPQGLYTKFEVKTVDDLRGKKFRSYNQTLALFTNLAGATAVQVEVPDIPQAFSTGQVEAMITSPSTGANSKAWDYVKYYSPINAWIPKNIVVVNKSAFDALDEATRKAILTASATAETRGWEMSKKEAEEKTKELKDNGMTVVPPSEALMTGLKKIGAEMQAKWADTASEAAKKVVADYQK
jgi:TRAP-type transport system periplasmic protein